MDNATALAAQEAAGLYTSNIIKHHQSQLCPGSYKTNYDIRGKGAAPTFRQAQRGDPEFEDTMERSRISDLAMEKLYRTLMRSCDNRRTTLAQNIITCAEQSQSPNEFARMLSNFAQTDLTGKDLRLIAKNVSVVDNKVNPENLIRELKLQPECNQVSTVISQPTSPTARNATSQEETAPQSPRKPQVVTQSQMVSSGVASTFGDCSECTMQTSAQARAPLYREPEEIQFKHRPGSAQKNRSQIDFSLPPERP